MCINSNYHSRRTPIDSDWTTKNDESDSEDTSSYDIRPAFEFACGGTYTGQWNGELRHGYGTQKWPDGSIYSGYWKNDKAHGEGSFHQMNGDVYVGRWKENMVHGHGKHTNSRGDSYEGYWKFDVHHGLG